MLRVLSVCLSVVLVGFFVFFLLIIMVELLLFLLGSCLVSRMNILMNQWKCSPSRLVSLVEVLAIFAATFCNTCVSQLRSWFIFYSNPFLIIIDTFSLH